MQPSVNTNSNIRRHAAKTGKLSVKSFLLIWIILITMGVTSTYLYSNYMKATMLQHLQQQLQTQLHQMKLSNEKQFKEWNNKLVTMQSKVQSLNELLTFTKDNASDNTDNSNKLYTQLSEVKKQLSLLHKKLELLKP